MRIPRSLFARYILALAALCMATFPALADTWPARPLRVIVPGGSGSPADAAMRALTDVVGAKLGQPLVIENKPGAQGAIGMDALVKAAPDGYTLGLINLQVAAMPAMRAKTTFDLAKDVLPVIQLTSEGPILAVTARLPVRSLKEFIAYAKARPGKLTYGSAGPGSPSHLGMEMLSRIEGLQLVHIPYKTIAAAVTDLAGGQVDLALAGSAAVVTASGTGLIRPLAVSSTKRLAALPKLPTFAEAGSPRLDLQGWVGLVVPAGTDPVVVARLNQEMKAALKDPKVMERLNTLGSTPVGGTSAAFQKHVALEMARWRQVVTEARITAD